MYKSIVKLIVACVLSSGISSLMAQGETPYEQKTLSDGSVETNYSQSGSQIKQTQRPDGTIETDTIDSSGNETITTQYPDGRVELKTKSKK